MSRTRRARRSATLHSLPAARLSHVSPLLSRPLRAAMVIDWVSDEKRPESASIACVLALDDAMHSPGWRAEQHSAIATAFLHSDLWLYPLTE